MQTLAAVWGVQGDCQRPLKSDENSHISRVPIMHRISVPQSLFGQSATQLIGGHVS